MAEDYEDDDDLILQFSNRPPRLTQTQYKSSSATPAPAPLPSRGVTSMGKAPAYSGTLSRNQNVRPGYVSNGRDSSDVNALLLKTQGEASILRDKIAQMQRERDHDKSLQLKRLDEINEAHQAELNNLRQVIQKLEDEKKFLVMESRASLSTTPSSPHISRLSLGSASASGGGGVSSIKEKSHATASPVTPKKKRKIVTNRGNSSVNTSIATGELNDHGTKTTAKPSKLVPLKPNRVTYDEIAAFVDSIEMHKIPGSEYTTMDILRKLTLGHIESFECRTLRIERGQSMGNALASFLGVCKRTLPLDDCIDMLLEVIAVLIKSIALDPEESNISLPFLITVMYQVLVFRPSAVHVPSLKDTFLFFCDLLKTFQHVIKGPLVKVSPEMDDSDFSPKVFQFELINNLVVFNSFDMLETSLRVLQLQIQIQTQTQPSFQNETLVSFFDESLLLSLERCCKLALPISYKPVLKVMFNIVEILNIVSNIVATTSLLVTKEERNNPNQNQNENPEENSGSSSSSSNVAESRVRVEIQIPLLNNASWWRDCIVRLYPILTKEIRNTDIYDDSDPNCIYSNEDHDSFGLIRNMGRNKIGLLIPKLIDFDGNLQFWPKVIHRDDMADLFSLYPDGIGVDFEFEHWTLLLKEEILNLLETLLGLFPRDPLLGVGDTLGCLAKFASREQEQLLRRNIGQDTGNNVLKMRLIEHSICLIYRIWIDNKGSLDAEKLKIAENDLLMLLWRVVVTSQNADNAKYEMGTTNMRDLVPLISRMEELSLKNEIDLYNDAFEDMPLYMEKELDTMLQEKSSNVLQIHYGEICIEMAKRILEAQLSNLPTMDDADSLYLAMGL